jgi:putative restriction endonuclease
VRAYVGITDGDWHHFLAERRADEVNFWRPSGDRAFHAVPVGSPFFFKTHHPSNRIVGGGFYSGFAALTVNEAWRLYGEANGADSLATMRQRVGRYRARPIEPYEDPKIGCLFIRDVVFFPPDDQAEAPPDFARSIVQGKSYELQASGLETYFAELLAKLLGASLGLQADLAWSREGPVYGDPRLAPNRLGQRAFQGVVLEAYRGRCAITGEKIRPVLQAAHIKPLPSGGEHRLDNGLLLRSDVHTLFDQGYLSLDPRHRLLVSSRLRREFENGDDFYALASAKTQISLPQRRTDRPSLEFLEWHRDEVFQPG